MPVPARCGADVRPFASPFHPGSQQLVFCPTHPADPTQMSSLVASAHVSGADRIAAGRQTPACSPAMDHLTLPRYNPALLKRHVTGRQTVSFARVSYWSSLGSQAQIPCKEHR